VVAVATEFRDCLVAIGAVSLATVMHEEGNEIGQGREIGAVYDGLAFAAARYKACLIKFFEMERDT